MKIVNFKAFQTSSNNFSKLQLKPSEYSTNDALRSNIANRFEELKEQIPNESPKELKVKV